VRNALGAKARIIGVQAANADAFARSWRTGTRVVGTRCDTFAEGMATRVTFDLPFGILSQKPGGLDDIITLTEDQLADGVRLALQGTHNLAEGAGAAALIAAWTQRHALAGQRVVCVMSGGNLNLPTLQRIVSPAHATTRS
jgi:threonine dehydratase